jgi:hypothetical protein
MEVLDANDPEAEMIDEKEQKKTEEWINEIDTTLMSTKIVTYLKIRYIYSI